MKIEPQSVYYDSAKHRSPMIEEFKQLLRGRDLLILLVQNSIKTRYKRSYFGIAWTMLNPLLYMSVMAVAFTSVFRSSLVNYPVYILTGLICWNFFAQTTTHAMSAIVGGGSLIRRIYIPRTIFAVSSVGNGLVNLGLALIPLVFIMFVTNHTMFSTWWFLPIAVMLLAMFTLGVALIVSTLAVFFYDVVDMYQIVIQALFFLTPVFYPKEIVPVKFIAFLEFNPMYYLIEGFRVPIYSGTLPEANIILTASIWAIATLILGWWLFTRKADEFAYRI